MREKEETSWSQSVPIRLPTVPEGALRIGRLRYFLMRINVRARNYARSEMET